MGYTAHTGSHRDFILHHRETLPWTLTGTRKESYDWYVGSVSVWSCCQTCLCRSKHAEAAQELTKVVAFTV